MGILWASYSRSPFKELPGDLTQAEFAERIVELYQQAEMFMVEDKSSAYDDTGPVAIVWIYSDGWEFEPHVEFMAWATDRNKLTSTVSFFQWIRFKRAIGLCKVESLKESLSLFNKCIDYGVLKYSGRLKAIDPRGTIYIFYIKGKNYVKQHKATDTIANIET